MSGFVRTIQAVFTPGLTRTVHLGSIADLVSPEHIRAAIDRALQERFDTSEEEDQQADEPSSSFDTDKAIDDFLKDMHFRVIVPGSHYSGLTNQRLLEILAMQGRDFAADTSELRDHVHEVLSDTFAPGLWDENQAVHVAADAIRAWIIDRVEEQGVDIELAPLGSAYLRRKLSQGLDPRIGVRKGRWLHALSNMRVLF